jgi:hypothetical protein
LDAGDFDASLIKHASPKEVEELKGSLDQSFSSLYKSEKTQLKNIDQLLKHRMWFEIVSLLSHWYEGGPKSRKSAFEWAQEHPLLIKKLRKMYSYYAFLKELDLSDQENVTMSS